MNVYLYTYIYIHMNICTYIKAENTMLKCLAFGKLSCLKLMYFDIIDVILLN